MDTALSATLLLIALFLWRAILRVERKEGERRVRRYRAEGVRRAVRRGGDVEEDALYLWRLYSAGHRASRRAVTQSHEMSAHRWNKAMAILTHLRLDPTRTPYERGTAIIQGYCQEQERLATRPTYVPPVV